MTWLLLLAIVLLGASALIWREVRNAPEGYEDAEGFHMAPGQDRARRPVSTRTAGGGVVLGHYAAR